MMHPTLSASAGPRTKNRLVMLRAEHISTVSRHKAATHTSTDVDSCAPHAWCTYGLSFAAILRLILTCTPCIAHVRYYPAHVCLTCCSEAFQELFSGSSQSWLCNLITKTVCAQVPSVNVVHLHGYQLSLLINASSRMKVTLCGLYHLEGALWLWPLLRRSCPTQRTSYLPRLAGCQLPAHLHQAGQDMT
jgi:hypothetical protein